MEDCGLWDLLAATRGVNKNESINDFLKDTSYPQALNQIWVDLERTYFIASNQKTLKDLIHAWTDDLNYTDYIQGDADGDILFLLNCYIENNPNFIEKHPDWDEYLKAIKKLRISYYDDKGIPCAVSINYTTKDPSLWTFCFVRNTTSPAEHKNVTFTAPEDLFYNAKNTTNLDSAQIQAHVTSLLQSKSIDTKLKGVFNENGHVNIEKLASLEKTPLPQSDKELIETGRSNFKAIYDRFINQYPKWETLSIDEINDLFKSFLIEEIDKTTDEEPLRNLQSMLEDYLNFEKKKKLNDLLIHVANKLIDVHTTLDEAYYPILEKHITSLYQLSASKNVQDFDFMSAFYALELKELTDMLSSKIADELKQDLLEKANQIKLLTTYKETNFSDIKLEGLVRELNSLDLFESKNQPPTKSKQGALDLFLTNSDELIKRIQVQLSQDDSNLLTPLFSLLNEFTYSNDEEELDFKSASFAFELNEFANINSDKIPSELNTALLETANSIKQLTTYKEREYIDIKLAKMVRILKQHAETINEELFFLKQGVLKKAQELMALTTSEGKCFYNNLKVESILPKTIHEIYAIAETKKLKEFQEKIKSNKTRLEEVVSSLKERYHSQKEELLNQFKSLKPVKESFLERNFYELTTLAIATLIFAGFLTVGLAISLPFAGVILFSLAIGAAAAASTMAGGKIIYDEVANSKNQKEDERINQEIATLTTEFKNNIASIEQEYEKLTSEMNLKPEPNLIDAKQKNFSYSENKFTHFNQPTEKQKDSSDSTLDCINKI